MAHTRTVRPPRAYAALKNSIEAVGVINPIVISSGGSVIIDGRTRDEIAKELTIPCPTISRRGSSWLAEERIAQRSNERDMNIRTEIIRLAKLVDDDGVGLFTEEAIARACGVSLQYAVGVLDGMVRMVADFLPLRRRHDDTTIVDSLVRAPDPGPERHPVLDYIPSVSDEAYAELVGDIVANGQQVPILVDDEGLLVDGRARWRACQELGITPVTEVITGNGWEASLAANRPRFPELNDRIVVVAKLPVRNSPTLPDDRRAPTISKAAELFEVPEHCSRAFRALASKPDTEGFQQAVLEGKIRLYTATRTVRHIPPDLWPAVLNRMLDEASRGVEPSLPDRPEGIPEVRQKAIESGKPRRRAKISMSTVDQAINSLAALKAVLVDADALDPSITSEQAADALRSLSTDRRQIGRLINLLKQRKEST